MKFYTAHHTAVSTPIKLAIKRVVFITILCCSYVVNAQLTALNKLNVVWNNESINSSQSMPCGGGDIGLNVWVENGELLFYVSKSGTFDENNSLLKVGRVRVRLSPNPFVGGNFTQALLLKDGYVKINGSNGSINAEINVWVDVFNPVIHVEVTSSKPVKAEAVFETWRHNDRPSIGRANNANSYKWAPQGEVKTWRDSIHFSTNTIVFFHRNKPGINVFDITVKQQGMDSVKDQMYNPIKDLTFGGAMQGSNMQPAGTTSGTYVDTDYKGWKLASRKPLKNHNIKLYLHVDQTPALLQWQTGLQQVITRAQQDKGALAKTRNWWHQFWDRSFIYIEPGNSNETSLQWQVGRNYQLMRYMLACNAFGKWPTKFNGGLFTYDPSLVDSSYRFTPDFRNWGGGTHTAQNQRLVYFPMLKSGDYDMMKAQFDFYLRLQKNAELRSKVYWGHNGACFTEQLENFGLPNPAEYGWKRPDFLDKGMEYNAWLEYQWDTVFEFCLMMLETQRYTGNDISAYIPFIESCLTFYNEHYQQLAKQRGSKTFDENGHLILYPTTGAETYKMAYNSTSTIAALHTILTRLLALPSQYLSEEKRKEWAIMLGHIPPISFAEINGRKTIAPAKLWERFTNVNRETVQLYPVFPWGMYGVGKPDIDVAINTWKLDSNVYKYKSHIGWRQHNIFAARLGLTGEAAELTTLKLKNSGRRFPAFWGPGFDWTPDHNWGGSGMIGLQEMLLQTNGEKIFLFAAWPKEWDVHFKLHAPYQTTVEAILKDGKVEALKVLPEARRKDVVMMLK
jgi:hypothetical protein